MQHGVVGEESQSPIAQRPADPWRSPHRQYGLQAQSSHSMMVGSMDAAMHETLRAGERRA